MQSVGAAKWPCNPALPSTYPMRNHGGTDGLPPAMGTVTEAVFTPSADQPPEEVPGDDVPSEADDARPE